MAVTDELIEQGFSALDLHGGLEQNDRDETLIRFANKSLSILVSTDVAARGLDVDSLDVVINFHLAHDGELHIHRIGRTGRAGSKGIAYSLFNDKEARKVARLEEYLGQSIKGEPLPNSELLSTSPMSPTMTTLKINTGRKQKLRPGNILGALTGEGGVEGSKVGKIHINDKSSYVAVSNSILKPAMEKLSQEKWKGRPLKGWLLAD
jgi:ATP-independent RNA helicase DbpA